MTKKASRTPGQRGFDPLIIEEYIRFSQIFDEQVRKYKDEPEKAYPEIFRICEEEGILTEYLKEHRSEVEKIMMTMVSPEWEEDVWA